MKWNFLWRFGCYGWNRLCSTKKSINHQYQMRLQVMLVGSAKHSRIQNTSTLLNFGFGSLHYYDCVQLHRMPVLIITVFQGTVDVRRMNYCLFKEISMVSTIKCSRRQYPIRISWCLLALAQYIQIQSTFTLL